MLDISQTIIAKSDQLNADDLLGGPITVTVTNVSLTESPDQPLTINYDGDNGRPFKPCKSMRRVLAALWGSNGNDFIGRQMTLFRDARVRWAGQEVGGVRISHMSDIPQREVNLSLQVTRGKKAPYKILRLDKTHTEQPKQRNQGTHDAAPETYPQDRFDSEITRIEESIKSGKATHEAVINHMQKTAPLTKDQLGRINSIQQQAQQAEDDEVF